MYVVGAIDDYSVTTRFVFGCAEPAVKLAQLLKTNSFDVTYTITPDEPERSEEEKARAQLILQTLFQEMTE